MLADKTKLEIVIPDAVAPTVGDAVLQSANTGIAGDGKIFDWEVSGVIKITTDEQRGAAV